MSKRIRNCKTKKLHKRKLGKRGAGLVELVIAMSLLTILTLAAFSFYEMMHVASIRNIETYDYQEEYGTLKQAITRWATENDTYGADFMLYRDGTIWVFPERQGGTSQGVRIHFEDDTLYLGLANDGTADKVITNLKRIKGISFTTDTVEDGYSMGTVIRCTVVNEKGELEHFVFAPRCGTVYLSHQ